MIDECDQLFINNMPAEKFVGETLLRMLTLFGLKFVLMSFLHKNAQSVVKVGRIDYIIYHVRQILRYENYNILHC